MNFCDARGCRPSSPMRAAISTNIFGWLWRHSDTYGRSSESATCKQTNCVRGCRAHYVAAGLLEFAIARRTLAEVTPVWMSVQFFPSLVEPVDGQEERLRIGTMNRNGHVMASGGFPHQIKAWVVDPDESPGA